MNYLMIIFFSIFNFCAYASNSVSQSFPSELLITGASVALVDHLVTKSPLKANSTIQLIIQVLSLVAKYFINRKK